MNRRFRGQCGYTEVQSTWSWQDWLGALAVRLAFRRMHYSVQPGLYAVNLPSPESPVFVSANYKLSFDHLRRALDGIAAWILVLDTKGINVWCAAGKGTLSTEELVDRVEAVRLKEVVTHRQLIVPQLAAPGVAAHQVRLRSDFRVIYGPVRAQDISTFLKAGLKATASMRRVRFGLLDRLAVVPVEMVGSTLKAIGLALVYVIIVAGRHGVWSGRNLYQEGLPAGALVLTGYLMVSIFIPVFLPWLPGRAFCVKGAATGILIWPLLWASRIYTRIPDLLTWFFLFATMGAFMGLNLTGASTYTSLSGVKKETRLAVPWMGIGLLISVGLWFWSCCWA